MVMYDIGMTDIRRLEPQVLLVFESLLETKSTTMSAARLGLSQSAVSGALKRLREIFDDPLFERHSRGLRPTHRANELSIPVSQILNSMRALSSSMEFDPATATGTINILATDYALATIIAPIREKLASVAPGLSVNIQAYSGKDAISNASLLSTDLLIGSPAMLPETLQTRHLKSDELVLFMSSKHRLANQNVSIDDFCSYPHVVVSLQGKSPKTKVDEILAGKGYSRVIDTITPSFLSLQTLIGQSERLSIAPKGLSDVVNDTLIYKPLPLDLPSIDLYVAWHKRFADDKRHRWLRRTIAAWVSK